MKLEIESFRSAAEAFVKLGPEWDELSAQIRPRTPHLSSAWCRLWWDFIRRNSITTRDEFLLHTVRDSDKQLLAIAPLMLTHKPAYGPFRIRLLQFLGADPSITEARGLICRQEHEAAATRSLAEHLMLRRHDWDVLEWRGIRDAVKAAEVLGPIDKDDSLPFYLLHLPSTYEALAARLSSNTRKSIRKSYAFLERDGYTFTVRACQSPQQVSAALDHFFALYAARSKAGDMTEHKDRLTNYPQHSTQVAKFAHLMAECGGLCIFELEIGGQVLASRITFLLGDELYLYYSGFDPRWRNYSIMTTLTTEIMKWAIDRGLRAVNLSSGTDLGKLRWRPEKILYYNKTLVAPTLRGRLAASLLKAAKSVRPS